MPDTAAPPNDRVNTPLLTLITQQSLDEDYRHVADRKALEPGAQRRTSGIAAIVVAVFGVLVTVAALQTQQGEDVRSASRTTLITQIDEGRANLSELQRRIVRLRELNVGLQSHRDEVTSDQLGAEARVQRLAASTGFGAVTGPGVKITVDDNPDGTLVRDRDLRPAVNGLWQAGAEAIAV